MNREVCLIMTPKLMELYKELQKNYPEECKASNVNAMVMLGWVENYQKDFDKTPDFTPDLKSLIPYVENLRKREGKSFLNKEVAQKSEANPILVQFIKDIETLAGYYEGGGRVLSDDVPNFPKELDDKLNDYFMGGKELSLDDYRKLWKAIEFKDGKVYARKSITTKDSNKQDIVIQLIDQLKASGITVLGKADMEKYLTENGKLDPVLNLQAIKENQEMQDIKAKALADGTFMKAPNGKPTNLTERQWLQVRTKNFINWFGDWINAAKANIISLGKEIPNKDKYSKYGQKGETDIEIREVLDENGNVIGTVRMEFSGKNRNGVVTLHPQLSVTGKGYGTALYQHIADTYGIPVEESFGEIGKSEAGKALWNKLQRDNNIQISKEDIPLRQLLPTNASKVVDENGEPLVVWHNTFAQFKTFKFTNEAAFHFGTKQAAEDRGGNNNRAFFLNIKDLHEYPDGMWYGMKILNELYREGLVTREQVNEIRNKASEARFADYIEDRGAEAAVYAEEIQKILGTKEYGFKYKNESEDKGSYSYGVLSPNQIKSATDNNGEFSTENDDIQMFIGKKARTQFEYRLRKARPDMSDAEIKSTLDFLHSLEDNKENTAYIKAAIRWIVNRSLTLPQDHTKAYQVFEIARKKHLDLQKYNTLGELIASPEMQPEEKEKAKFNPDEAKTFSNKRTVTTKGGRVFTVYDVENTEEGQREVCKALAAHYETSPWCLSTFTSKGEPTQSAKTYWDYYNALPRKIAFENGKPVAFNSAKEKEEDIKLNGLPVTRGDDGETLVIQVNPNSANDITKLNKMAEEGLVLLAKYDKGVAWPTEEGEKLLTFSNTNNEAWWDVADTHPQDSLSDSIISDISPERMLRGVAEMLAEYLGLLGTPGEIDTLVEMQQRNIPITEANYRSFVQGQREFVPAPVNPFPEEEMYDLPDDLPFFITPNGEVYGFVDKEGNIYLDETVISPEHPIHEYTHLWDIILSKKNPALWNRGKQLLKDKNLKLKGHEKSIWQEIEEDPNYGLKWDKTKAYYEDYVASEVHARITGKKGLQLLDEIAEQKGSKNIISKLKQWILDVYKELKATFSKWTPEELDKLTIKDFTYMTLRDFTSGMNLSTVPTILKETSDPNINKEQVNEAKNTLYNIIQTSKFRIDQIQDKIKWNKATKEDIQNLNKYKVKLKEDTELLAGLDTGKSEVYINEYNTPMVRWVNKKEKPSPKINIYAGTGENADLSNFAERPFKTWYPYHNNKPNKVNLEQGERSFVKNVETDLASTKGDPQQRKILTLSVSDIFGGVDAEQFKTVEGAFQAAKLAFIDLENQDSPYFYYKDSLSGSARPLLTEEGKQLIKRLQEATGAEAKSIGRQIKGLNKNLWDSNSSEIMKELLRLSFLQNPQSLQRLLATGDATLTHTQDRGKWGTEFPKLLMEVRDELREEKEKLSPSAGQSNAEFYSGAADGSDKEWGSQARALGIKVTDYTRESWNKLSQEWKDKLSSEYEEVAVALARPVIPLGNRGDIEVRRDMMQADKADAIFAIGSVVGPNQKGSKYINKSNHDVVDGGTGYAVQRGIIRGIPVYVFDQSDNTWKVWNNDSKSFVSISEPTLTPHAATIGTRDINNAGKAAIRSILQNSLNVTDNRQSSNRGLSNLESNAVDLDVNDKDLEIAKETVKMEKQKVTKPESESLKSSLQVKEDRFTKFKQTLSPQQINDAGVRMAVLFTEKLNILVAKELERLQEMQEDDSLSEKDKEVIKERLITIQDPIKGRQEVATSYGIANLLDDVKESMKKVNPYGYKEHPERLTARDNVLEYFNEIFNAKASQEIELVEGIQIIDLETKVNEEDNDVLDTNDDTENVATGSDGWSFKMRLQNPANSLSSKVRLMLSGIEKVDALDSLGYTAYYPVGQVYATCLSYISRNLKDADDFMQIRKSWDELQEEGGSSVFFATGWIESKEDFESTYPYGVPVFPILEKMKDRYPRIAEEMIIRLTNDFAYPREVDPNNPRPTFGSLASQFYAGFKLAMIPYGKIKLGGEAFGITPLNYEMSDRIMYDKLVANYNNRIALTDECIYNSDGSINTENLKSLWGGIHRDLDTSEEYVNTPILNDDNWEEQEYTKEEYEDYKLHIQRTTHDLRSLGIDITEDDIKGYIASGEITTLLENAEKVVDNLTRLKDNEELKEGFDYILDTRDIHKRNLWKDFFTGIGTINSDHYLQSYYDPATGKTKYSYSADNYLMKIFRGIAMGTLEERRQFIDEHFGKYEWFKNQKTGEWKNAWLEYYYNQTKVVGSNGEEIPNFNYPYKNIDNVTYPDGKVSTYTKWTNEDIWYVQHRSYAYRETRARGGDPYGEGSDAYYLTPIFSDSPMSMTVLGPKFSLDVLLNNKDKFTDKWDWAKKSPFIDLVLQEVQRIQNVANRKKHIKEGTILPISNYDGIRGLEFCFLPELNNYYFDEGDSFLDRIASMKDNASTEEIENIIMRAVTDILENRFYEYLNINKDVITGNGFNFEDAEDMYKLRKEFYNSVYANAAIIQLTTVDLAFYKNEIDFQKRFKEVYAGGTQLNTSSRYGKKTENVAIISDDIITSPSYKDIAEIIDNSNRLSQEDKNYIKGIFKEVNVGDAQAIRSMHSFRSVLDMLGDWDNNRMEEALTHFKQGSWHREDFDVIYQTIKPFMFTVINKSNGDGTSIAVPQQHKNSEICAIMMYNLINESYAGSQSPVYQALSEFMDETVDASGNKLVDMIQFESAVKTGNQGVVNISCNPNKVMSVIEEGVLAKGADLIFETANNGKTPNDIEHAIDNFKAIKKQADDYLEEGKLSQENYDALIAYLRPTKDEIKEILTKNLIQTNSDGTKTINPERVHTIPFRNYYKQQPTPEHHIDAKAVDGSQARNIIVADLPEDFKLEVPCKEGTKVIEGRDALINFYYELLNENLIEDFFGKGAKKGLKGLFSSKKELKEAIKQIVRGNPKYSDDFLEALDTNEDGSFKLSPNSPTMFNQMQDIITSFFKNRITKQSINGAALIQAAGIGFDDSLRLRFKDGKLIGIECYMPLTSKDLFEPLLVEREIDGKIVKVLDPEKLKELGLDKAVGYRIPTENKSSIAPLIIKGFTSPQNGSAIMLPAEITALSGSDFDVDKMFIMLLAFNVITHDMKKAFYDYARSEHEKAQEMINALGKANIEDLDVDEIGQNFKEWFEEHKDEYVLDKPIIKKVQYDFSKSPKENGRKARNNMLIQIRYGILTSKECADLVLNPQGFKDVKRAAKISQIVNNPTLFQSFLRSEYTEDLDSTDTDAFMDSAINRLLKLSTSQLKKFIQDNSISDSPIYPQTFTKSHARNMAGSNQIGIYAIQGSMCAKQQRATITLRPQQQFTINGKLIKNVDVSDEGRRMRNTNQMVGASADNGKDPNLTDMGSTSKTAPIIGLMLREGLSHLEASLLINQPCMKLCYYNSKNKYWYGFKNKYMQTAPVDTVTLIKNIVDPDSLDTLEKTNIDLICYHILQQHEGMEFINKVSRADSPNGALGNSYAKGRVQRYKVDVLQAMMGQDEYPFNKVTETLSNTAVDTSASENTVREQLKNQKMGLLHGMYALGINSFDTLMKNYFFGAQKWFDEKIVKPILYSLPVDTPEETLASIVNSIYKSYMIYKLSSSPLFGDEENTTVEQKKKYYNESFPDDFVTILHENEDIRKLLGDVLQVSSTTGKKRIILQNNGVSSSTQKQAVKDRLESLIYSSNPKAHELAVQLLLYSYFVDGLQYNRYSFSTYFSSKYLMSIPMYSEACNHFSEEMDDKDCLNFVMQFLNTYPSAATKMDRALKESDITIEDDTLIVSNYADYRVFKSVVNPLLSPNPKKEVNLYPYISYDGILYVLDKEALKNDPSHPTYYKLPRYDTNHFTPFFTSQRSIEELAESKPIKSSSNTETQYDEDFFVDETMDDTNDLEIAGFSEGFNTADPSELYAREGENELQDKFC